MTFDYIIKSCKIQWNWDLSQVTRHICYSHISILSIKNKLNLSNDPFTSLCFNHIGIVIL